MKNKNWIWFAFTLLAVAAAGACVFMLRHSPRHGMSVMNAPPPMEEEQSSAQAPEAPAEPAVEASVPGALAVSALYERCRAVLASQDETAGAYPVEEAELSDGGEGVRFVRARRRVSEEGRGYLRREDAAYLVSEDLELLGDGASDVLTRTTETFTEASVPAFVISCGGQYLRLEGEEFRSSGEAQATRWAEEPETGYWYTVSAGRRRYLNAGGLDSQGRTRWSLEGGALRGDDPDGVFELCCDGDWTVTAAGAFYLADAQGRCLNMDNTGVLPDTGLRTRWIYDRDPYGLGGYFHTYLNGRQYALCLEDGELALSTDPYAEYWIYQGGSVYLNRGGVFYCLNCRGGVWRAEPMTAWRIAVGWSSYLTAGSDGLEAEGLSGDPTLWRIESAGEGVVICTAEGDPRYLSCEDGNIVLSARLRTVWQQEGGTLRTEEGGLCYRDGWQLGEADGLRYEQASLPMPQVTELDAGKASAAALLSVEDMQLAERGETIEVPTGAVCCVPLCCGEDLSAAAENPGYLCPGDTPMRLESLDGASFSAALAKGEMEALTRAAPDGASRAARSDEGDFGLHCRRFLEQVPAGGVWGLRLSGEPRAEDTTALPLARFGGQSLRDCPLVRGAADLRLTAQGTLSLFALGGEGGFALYSVERDPATAAITELRRIDRIFLGQDGYVYDYAEGGMPVREDAVLAFDTAWLRGDTAGSLYYYEIPLNAGEYALGADGGEAVLLYLAVSEQALGEAPAAAEAAEVWDALSDRSLLSFLGDGANAEALGTLLRADRAASLVERVALITDGAMRDRASALLEALSAPPETEDWRALSDAAFVDWLCDPANGQDIRNLPEEERRALSARAEALASHEDYFRARDRLTDLS